jgi:deazaflavin-dependent oxidoreductase (nitroreductase family)
MSDFNGRVIEEFRAKHGKPGGMLEGAPMVIVHHVGRVSGRAYETPLVYQPGEDGRMFIFASKGGAPQNPEWYHNLLAAGSTMVEVGDERFDVKVSEVTGPERDRVFAQQKRAMPGFAEYEVKTAGVRTIPVLALDPA